MACVTEAAEQGQTVALRQRLTARHADVPGIERGDAREDVIEVPPFTAAERIGRVAVLATQRTTREAHEHRGKPTASPRPAAAEDSVMRSRARLPVDGDRHGAGTGRAGDHDYRGVRARRSLARRAASVPGNRVTTCCRLVRPASRLPCSSWV